MRISLRFASIGLLALGAATACSSQRGDGGHNDSDAGTPPGTDAGVSIDPATSLEVEVVLTSSQLATPMPAANVLVALDRPQGDRVEQMTDARGKTTFIGLDWSMGSAAVTAAPTGALVTSRIGITRADGPVRLRALQRLDTDSYPRISGMLTGRLDDTHQTAVVSAAVAADNTARGIGAFNIRTQPSVAFKVVALEYLIDSTAPARSRVQQFFQWAVVDHEAITSDAMFSIDMTANRVTPERVSGSFRTPNRVASPTRDEHAMPYAVVTTPASDRNALFGAPTRMAMSMDGSSVTYDFEFLRSLPESEVQQVFGITSGVTYSYVVVPGYPTAGEQTFRLPDPASVRNVDTARNLGDAIEWDVFGDAAPNTVQLRSNGVTRWVVQLPTGATSARMPTAPPSNTTFAEIFGDSATSVTGRPTFCEPADATLCMRGAFSRGVELRLP